MIRNWDKIHLNVNLLMHVNWELRISGHDAAEVHSPEVHRRAEANPTCEDHKGYCTSHQNSTKIFRSDIFICPGEPHQRSPNAPKNLRIGLWRRQSGKSKVPAKQCGILAKMCQNSRSIKEQHSSHLRKTGACLHQLLNLRKENLLSTPERQCT